MLGVLALCFLMPFGVTSTDTNEGPTTPSPPCTMHTYFSPQPGEDAASQAGNIETLESWKNAWKMSGWNVRVLTEEDAQAHAGFSKLNASFADYPTVNPRHYEMACFLRHLAMAQVGGGWMSDYDVLPLNLPACAMLSNNGSYTTHQVFIPSLVSGTSQEYFRVSTLLADIPWQENPSLFSYNNRSIVSDMLALRYLSTKNLIQTYPPRGVHRGCGLVEVADMFEGSSLSCFNVCPPPPRGENASAAQAALHGPLAAHASHRSMSMLQGLAKGLGPLDASPLHDLPSPVLAALRGDVVGNNGAKPRRLNFHQVRRLVIEATQLVYKNSCATQQ